MDFELIFKIFLGVLSIVIPIIVEKICKFIKEKLESEKIKKHIDTEKLKRIEAQTIVTAVQQMFEVMDGSKKLEIAIDLFKKKMNEIGIEVTETEIRNFIEEAVKILKLEFGEKWKTTITTINDNS